MTKVISLSNEAYQTLKGLKRSNESFSDVVLRMANAKQKRSLLQLAGTWKGSDIDQVYLQVKKDREQSASREIGL